MFKNITKQQLKLIKGAGSGGGTEPKTFGVSPMTHSGRIDPVTVITGTGVFDQK
ncbi:hypothetical protein [Pseudoalteromonas rubra]|uniref:hypothetical protein n=1 Tax=Pseudoalteromonas rubra TaxID=43658 RepID=UPI0014874558|nr:hypothetical protein [Pseudoalteromonas rubra]